MDRCEQRVFVIIPKLVQLLNGEIHSHGSAGLEQLLQHIAPSQTASAAPDFAHTPADHEFNAHQYLPDQPPQHIDSDGAGDPGSGGSGTVPTYSGIYMDGSNSQSNNPIGDNRFMDICNPNPDGTPNIKRIEGGSHSGQEARGAFVRVSREYDDWWFIQKATPPPGYNAKPCLDEIARQDAGFRDFCLFGLGAFGVIAGLVGFRYVQRKLSAK